MLALSEIRPDFWKVASALGADLIYAGRTDEAAHNQHWRPGGHRCYVYILSSGLLPCYIGKSYDPHMRFRMHRRREWWGEAEHLTVFMVVGANREDGSRKALALEAAAIRSMRPAYNIAGVV